MYEHSDESSQQIIAEEVMKASGELARCLEEASKVVVGSSHVCERILSALLCRGHILLEGLPGLAKTTSIKTMSHVLQLDFSRVQFTPDLLPADLLGTQIYDPSKGEFKTKKGPAFTQLLLADEINRAPAKVQSALLESMGEKQITLGDHTYKLTEPYMVMATQNPIEQEGTYVLPEAQVDRFLFKVHVGYCTQEEEKEIIKRNISGEWPHIEPILDQKRVLEIRELLTKIHVSDQLRDYIVRLVFATRVTEKTKKDSTKARFIDHGASPRASIFLELAARAHALINGRAYVLPQDVKDVGLDVLTHRIGMSYEAEAEGVTAQQVVQQIFDTVDVP